MWFSLLHTASALCTHCSVFGSFLSQSGHYKGESGLDFAGFSEFSGLLSALFSSLFITHGSADPDNCLLTL